jgi:hypothetical protein
MSPMSVPFIPMAAEMTMVRGAAANIFLAI